jgi:LysM repeat protein
MKDGWPGFLAVILFLILILLFLASTATPEITAESQLLNNSGAAPAATTATPAVNLNVGPTAQLVVNPTVVNATQSLTMPILPPGAAVYVVQQGDWLSDIARRHNTTVAAILAANPQLTTPDAIYPGQTLVLP